MLCSGRAREKYLERSTGWFESRVFARELPGNNDRPRAAKISLSGIMESFR
jgi:hypothetical protein